MTEVVIEADFYFLTSHPEKDFQKLLISTFARRTDFVLFFFYSTLKLSQTQCLVMIAGLDKVANWRSLTLST